MNIKYLILSVFILLSFALYGQTPPQVTIFQPLNNTLFDGYQIKVEYIISGTAPNFARIYVDDKPVQILTEVKLGQNTTMVDVPGRDCKITVVAVNDFGENVPAVVNLKRNECHVTSIMS